MRIALITPGFSADDGDWCIPVLQDFARCLNENHDVRVYTTCYPLESHEYSVKGIPVQSFGDGRQGRLSWCRRQFRALSALIADHDDAPFDIVHGFWSNGGGVVCALFCRNRFVPSFVTAMGGELIFEPVSRYGKRRRPIAGRLARYGAMSATNLNVSSPWHRAKISEEQPQLSPELLMLGTDMTIFNETTEPLALEGAVPIICAASLVTVKGHEIVFRAFSEAAKNVAGLHLHLIGEGELENSLRNLAAQLGIESMVTFHGHVAHHHLPRYFRAAEFCVLGSYFENHGMVILEAAACGRVTIGSAVGSMPQFCRAEYLSKPGDVESLATAMRIVATDNDLARNLGRSAANSVRGEYTLDHMVQAFETAYRNQSYSTLG